MPADDGMMAGGGGRGGVGSAAKDGWGAGLRQRKPNKRGDHTAHNGGEGW